MKNKYKIEDSVGFYKEKRREMDWKRYTRGFKYIWNAFFSLMFCHILLNLFFFSLSSEAIYDGYIGIMLFSALCYSLKYFTVMKEKEISLVILHSHFGGVSLRIRRPTNLVKNQWQKMSTCCEGPRSWQRRGDGGKDISKVEWIEFRDYMWEMREKEKSKMT